MSEWLKTKTKTYLEYRLYIDISKHALSHTPSMIVPGENMMVENN